MIVSLSKLRQVVTVARFSSLTRAAEDLRISQPALSRNVAFVEDVYGVKIFDRLPQGVAVTAAGSAIIAEAARVLRSADTFDHNATLIGGGRLGYVSFGMGPILSNAFMGQVAVALIKDGKQISFRAQTRSAEHLVKALMHEDIELGVVGNAKIGIPDEIEVRQVGTMRTAAIVRRGHPLARQRNIGIEQVRHFPIASPLDLNQLRAFEPIPHHISCDDYLAMKEMVLATDTICFCGSVFAHSVSENGEIEIIDFDIPVDQQSIDVLALTLKGRTTSPAVELIIDCCREVLANAS
jgi:LysR family pca operon transcriptional activator